MYIMIEPMSDQTFETFIRDKYSNPDDHTSL